MSARDPSSITPHPGPPTFSFPTELKQLRQWCVHREGVPHQQNGAKARTNDPTTFCTFIEALKAKRDFDGISFIVTADGPHTAIDLDDCLADDGSIKPDFKPIVAALQRFGAYLEYSRHGKNIHAFIRGKKPADSPCKRSFGRGREAVEIYDKAKALTVTGKPFGTPPDAIGGSTAIVTELHKLIFCKPNLFNGDAKPMPLARRSLVARSDEAVMASARNRIGDKVDRLTAGNWQSDYASQSDADLAYCVMLATETSDEEQINRIVEASGLCREKWTDRSDYRAMTIRKALAIAATPPPASRATKRQKPDREGVAALTAGCRFFLHNGEPHVSFRNLTGRWLIHAVGSEAFGREILRRVWSAGGTAPSAEEIKQIQQVSVAQTLHESAEEPVYRRIAWVENNTKLLIDLGDAESHIAIVTAAGVEVQKYETPPVNFQHGDRDEAWPMPECSGQIDELRPFLHVDNNGFILAVAAVLGSFLPEGIIPPLVLFGEKGTGKSKAAEVIQRLRDPQRRPPGIHESESPPPRSEKALHLAARQCGGMLAFGNMSNLTADQADSICRIAGGSQFETKRLYTTADTLRFDVRIFVVMGGIGDEMYARDDFLDRAILLPLRPFSGDKRKSESAFYADFCAAYPRIFGAILNLISAALRNWQQIPEQPEFRMSGFTRWVTAAEPSCRWPAGAFATAYRLDRDRADDRVLSESEVGQGIIVLLETRPDGWCGTAGELLAELERLSIGRGGIMLPQHLRNSVSIGKHIPRLTAPLRRRHGIYHVKKAERKSRVYVHHFSHKPINLPPSR